MITVSLREIRKPADDIIVSDILRYVITAGGVFVLVLLFRSRFAWRVYTFVGALLSLVLILGFLFSVRYLVQEPSPRTIFFIVVPLILPAFLLIVLWLDLSPPDPFGPVPEGTMKAYADLIERLDTGGFRLEAAAVQRGPLGMASLVFVNRSDQIIALVAGNNPKKALLWLYSQIVGHLAVLSTATHGSGARPPGELRHGYPENNFQTS